MQGGDRALRPLRLRGRHHAPARRGAGLQPKTPYRYFKDKADILATVRAQAFEKFADALEKRRWPTRRRSGRSGAGVGEAYHRFAMKNPHAYRIMFDIDAPIDESHPDLGPQAGVPPRTSPARPSSSPRPGVIDVDPTLFGWSMWAATHGLVMLHQAGMLEHAPDYRTLAQFHGAAMLKGAAPAAPAKKPGKKR